jgi:HD superfamily phosphohydrolase YqeK
MLTKEKIYENKDEIITLLKSTNRDGIDNVIDFLNNSGYFHLYGSFNHHTYKGGLAEHSLGVYKLAKKFNKNCNEDSVIICSLLHDICKTKYNFPEGVEYKGHGSKSVAIIEDFIKFKLTEEERLAIRFHMKGNIQRYILEEGEDYEKAKKSDLRNLIYKCDKIDAGRYNGILQNVMWKTIKC